jgi:hypothetical protein
MKRNRQQQEEKSRTIYTYKKYYTIDGNTVIPVCTGTINRTHTHVSNFANIVSSKLDRTSCPPFSFLTKKGEQRTGSVRSTPLLCQCSPTKAPRMVPTTRMVTARTIQQRPPLLSPLQRHLRHRQPSQQPLLPQKPHRRLPLHPRRCPKQRTRRI